jgi:hypothetical protein
MVKLSSKMSDFGPQIIQGLPLPTHCIQRKLQYDVHYRALEYLVLCSSITFIYDIYPCLLSDEFVPFLMGYGASQRIQLGFNKMVPELT